MKKLYMMLAAIIIGCTSFSASAVKWWISGAFNNWNHAQEELMYVEDGVYATTLPSLSGEFLICQGTKGNPDWGSKIGTNGQKVVAGKNYKYVQGAGNFVMDGTVNNATVTLDTNQGTILVTGQYEENDYSEIYIIGDINDGGWNENLTSYPLTLKAGYEDEYEGTYTFTGETNYFKLKAGSYVYGTDEDNDIEVEPPFFYNPMQGGDYAFVIGPGEYHFSFSLGKNAFYGDLIVEKSTGSAAGIEAADGEAAYYTLQGIRIDEPTDGLYIKVLDGKASKVVIRK